RDKANVVELPLQIFQYIHRSGTLLRMPLHLFADRVLTLQVGDLLFFSLTMLTPALFEEIIARFLALLEDLLPESFRNGANLFPLRLQCLQLSRNRLPVCAFLQLTSTCYQLVLELQVLF